MFKKVLFVVLVISVFLFSCFAVFAATQSSSLLTVSKADPANSQQKVSVSKTLTIKFNAKIYKGKKFSKITLTKSDKKPISISSSLNSSVLSIKAKSKLAYYTKYYLTIPVDSIKNSKGISIKKNYVVQFTTEKKVTPAPTPTPKPTGIQWKLAYDETFDTPFNDSGNWTVQDYKDTTSPYNVDPVYGDNGSYFPTQNSNFKTQLSSFQSCRKSFTYGQDGWLTVEEYGRDTNKDGVPESGGGKFVEVNGKAELISTEYTDAAIIRSTNALPQKYKIQVTVSNINFGGKDLSGSWTHDGKYNGYDEVGGKEMAGPWDTSGTKANPATAENGVYFLCITDYPKPAPHNNIFIHHHRKVVMDTDNNTDQWSQIWNPNTHSAVVDGSHYVNMLWLDGSYFGSDNTGNDFISWTPGGWMTGNNDCTFADKYMDNQAYTYTIERDGTSYTMSMTGTFYYGGLKTYTASRKFTEDPTWHYNQNPQELKPGQNNETITKGGVTFNSWPSDSSYPDYFFFGDPHINYYEGTALFDDVKLYLPQ